MRFRSIWLLLVFAITTGCATVEDKRLDLKSLGAIEIFYNTESHAVVHHFGQQAGGLMVGLSFIAPIGPLLALGAVHAAETKALDDSSERSAAFNRGVRALGLPSDMNREFAERLADQLRADGREVKLTEVRSLPGDLPGQGTLPAETEQACADGVCTESAPAESKPDPDHAGNGYTATPGHTSLLLRVTTGYGASDLLGEYEPMVVVEAALADPETVRYLGHAKLVENGYFGSTGYYRWDSLEADIPRAREQLRERLLLQVTALKKKLFQP